MTSVENGQITLASSMGQLISSIASNDSYKVYLEIGTWRGGGSTKCFADSILKRNDDVKFISIECNKEMYDQAALLWRQHLSDRFKILHGRIIEEQDLQPESSLMKEIDFSHEWINWLRQDIVAMRSCSNVIEYLPKEIDVVLLDGGEFSSFAEFRILENRTKVFILDDTKPLKNRMVRQELLSSTLWNCLEDRPNERQGYSVFARSL